MPGSAHLRIIRPLISEIQAFRARREEELGHLSAALIALNQAGVFKKGTLYLL